MVPGADRGSGPRSPRRARGRQGGRHAGTFIKTGIAASVLALLASAAVAQEYLFRLHHFLGAQAPAHTRMLEPWARAVEANSDGRVETA